MVLMGSVLLIWIDLNLNVESNHVSSKVCGEITYSQTLMVVSLKFGNGEVISFDTV